MTPALSMADLHREAEIRAYEVLGRSPLPALQQIADLAARICGVEMAEINMITATEQVHLAASDRNEVRVPKDQSFCGRVIAFEVPTFLTKDARQESVFSGSPFVTGEITTIVFYAATHLVAPSGTVLGTLCVFDSETHDLDDSQLAALEGMGRLVVQILEAHRTHLELKSVMDGVFSGSRELIRSNESLAGFAGQVSHDMQGPLASVMLALELLEQETALDPDSAVLLSTAFSGARRMQRTITDLMDFAHVGGGTPPVRVDLDAVAAEVLSDLRAAIGESKVEVSPLPLALANESELRVILQNLLANALKFAGAHGPAHVEVFGERRGERVRVVVRDNGPGVPEADRSGIFGLLVRGRTDLPGHGIGLATCARILASRGGTIGVEESPSGGSDFWFELPAAV